MPRPPHAAVAMTTMTASPYSTLLERARQAGELYPLHIGDTWMEPAAGCRMQDLRVEDHPGMHRYSPPPGLPQLRDALAQRVTRRTGHPTSAEEILIAAGATGALACAVGAIVDPGDEVLILAPHWPLIAGSVRTFRGTVGQVPFLGRADSPESAVEIVEEAHTERSVALYLSTPNNPTGRLIPRSWIEALVTWARRRDLWILADEVYEDFVYEGEHTATRPLAPERTIAAYSFSKAYGMAGNRCGYLAGPAPILAEACKVATHTFYNTPTAAQIAALRVLEGRADDWLVNARQRYAELGRAAAARIGEPAPNGSTFFFLDVEEQLEGGDLGEFLGRCADRGLLVSPGPSFGPYPHHVRVCFTCADPPIVERGFGVLAELLGR